MLLTCAVHLAHVCGSLARHLELFLRIRLPGCSLVVALLQFARYVCVQLGSRRCTIGSPLGSFLLVGKNIAILCSAIHFVGQKKCT